MKEPIAEAYRSQLKESIYPEEYNEFFEQEEPNPGDPVKDSSGKVVRGVFAVSPSLFIEKTSTGFTLNDIAAEVEVEIYKGDWKDLITAVKKSRSA